MGASSACGLNHAGNSTNTYCFRKFQPSTYLIQHLLMILLLSISLRSAVFILMQNPSIFSEFWRYWGNIETFMFLQSVGGFKFDVTFEVHTAVTRKNAVWTLESCQIFSSQKCLFFEDSYEYFLLKFSDDLDPVVNKIL